jgi:hypothetical protein
MSHKGEALVIYQVGDVPKLTREQVVQANHLETI